MKKLYILLCLAIITLLLPIVSEAQEKGFTPQINGTVRTRYEYEPATQESRFQVRNARLSVSGEILPEIGYQVQVDFCDRGKMKVLDAYASFGFLRHFKLMAGQMIIPFTLEAPRGPHLLIFAEKSYIARQIGNHRDVGMRLRYDAHSVPIWIIGGVFNADVMTDHNVWEKELSYAATIGYRVGNLHLQVGGESVYPDSVRINRVDFSAQWICGRWLVEGEYMQSFYTHNAYKSAKGYQFAVDYHMPVKAGICNRLSFQGRFDGITNTSDGYRDSEGKLSTTYRRHNRITLGATLSHVGEKVRCDFRLNGNILMYPSGTTLSIGDHSRLVAEVVVRF